MIVNEGDFEDQTTVRYLHSSRFFFQHLIGICLRFAQILFFDRRNKNIHARWFIHGSETILQEVSHGQELFLSIADDCRDVSTDCLVSKCDVVRISLAQHAAQTWPAPSAYFYSCVW